MPNPSPTDDKTTRIEFRTSTSEKTNFNTNAQACGFRSVSDYVRWLNHNFSHWLKAGKVPLSVTRQEHKKADPKLVYELNKVGVNLMQLLRQVHRFRDVEESEIKLVLSKIDTVLERLLPDV